MNDNVSGVEATQYLESKGVIVLLNPADFIAKTKLDFQDASQKGGFRSPANTPNKFPKIVKYVDGLASMGMDYNSVCYSENEVVRQVELLKDKEPNRRVLVQDFICGRESTVIVMEMGSEVTALAPVDWVFDPQIPADRAWLTYSNKFEALNEGKIHLEFVLDEPRRSSLCNAAIASFKALGMQGHGGWGRVDMRCEENTGDIYCLELNHMPALFYPEGNKLSDDIIIRETFPGGHEAFFEMLLYTKKFQIAQARTNPNVNRSLDTNASPERIGELKARGSTIAEVYDSCIETYDQVSATTNIYKWQVSYFATYDYSGTVLDLACGTGGIGKLIHQKNPGAKITGVDVSTRSLQTPQVLEHYLQPTIIGYLQHEIMRFKADSFDHIVCFGALHFLDRTEFMASVSRMFMVSRKTVTFDVDNVSIDYINSILKCFGEGLRNYNNIEALRRFGTPKGWKKAVDEEISLYYSPSVQVEVTGRLVRFEKI